ncbi:MAG: hypothetical protein ACOC6P_03045 [Candidatus Aminicenantaceae bacterium]
MRKSPRSMIRAAVGCGVIMIFATGIFGIVISFFANDPQLARATRSRCLIGIAIGIAMIIAWKIYSSRTKRKM